jgi:pimeloyl-ACP methyl ester carboxylesterase
VRDAAALDTNQTMELVPKLAHLAVPTWVVWGVDDALLPVKYAERLAWEIPGARRVRVEDAKHYVMWDQPHAVMTALFEVLGVEGRALPREEARGEAPPPPSPPPM